MPAFALFNATEHHPIDNDPPLDFAPRYVIFRELGEDTPWAYTRKDIPRKISDIAGWTDIATYVESLVSNGYPKHDPEPKDEARKLTIPIPDHAYIILALHDDIEYDFAYVQGEPDIKGIDLGRYYDNEQLANDSYGELRHVDPATGASSVDAIPGCRMVYFSATPTPVRDTKQKVNFNLMDSDEAVTIVDPDIRYPGNGTAP